MKIHLSAAGILFVALVCFAVGSLAGFPAPAFAQEGGAISGSIEEKNEPETKPDTGPKTGPLKDEESGGFRIPPFGVGLSMGITTALATQDGTFLIADGGGLEIGITAGAYPALFVELGLEGMRFDVTTENDKENNRKQRIEMYGYFMGAGVGLPFKGGGIGLMYRLHPKNRIVLEIENGDTDQTEITRNRVTRRTYFLFITRGGKKGKGVGGFFEIGFRYDDVDVNTFLISDVIGVYLRFLILF